MLLVLDRQIPGAPWPFSLAKMVQKVRLKAIGKATIVNLWPLCVHAHTVVSAPLHICTQAYTQEYVEKIIAIMREQEN